MERSFGTYEDWLWVLVLSLAVIIFLIGLFLSFTLSLAVIIFLIGFYLWRKKRIEA